MKGILSLGAASALWVITGCSLAPDYERPEDDFPSELGLAGTLKDGDNEDSLDQWWEAFDDPTLNEWVAKTLEANGDLGEAAARIRQARALYGLEAAQLWPNIDFEGTAARTEAPDYQVSPGQDNPSNQFGLSGLLNYEVDLFNKLGDAKDAAREDLLSTSYAFFTLRNSLISETVSAYYGLQSSVNQLALAQETIQTREEAVGFQQKRFDAGFSTELELQQSKAELADAKVRVPQFQEAILTYQTSLLILSGADPSAFWNRDVFSDEPKELPEVPEVAVDLIPSSVLERRPDILSAEAALRSTYENIGVAKAQRWPSLSLGALLGTSAAQFDNLFTSPSQTWNIGANVTGPIIDFGRNKNRVLAAEARQEEAFWIYKNTVREAFSEVNESILTLRYREELVAARVNQEKASSRLLELAKEQYDEGFSEYIDYLDAERQSFEAELTLEESRFRRLNAAVNLFKALGGGWEGQLDESAMEPFDPQNGEEVEE
ncbi:efflux transporter outer membrane subunit [Puniceicoccus vermicola]|uniref:TolC family protein n=1 Tax=Puniceicoccus vermicola TaxID=388746 RepID=A0A7X1AWX4_9BACT|nr:TolC family protein [Puniceicoccus vermicola]MBC2601284.1 TolC family protein [Puniceicoccus vermicola]